MSPPNSSFSSLVRRWGPLRGTTPLAILLSTLGGCGGRSSLDQAPARPTAPPVFDGGTDAAPPSTCSGGITIPSSGATPTECIVTLARGGFEAPLAVEGPTIFYAFTDSHELTEVATSGSTPPVTFSKGPEIINGIATDATDVYWTVLIPPVSALMKAPIDGGAPITLATTAQAADRVVLDDANVYWTSITDLDGGMILRTPKQGGATFTIAVSPVDFPYSLAVDSDYAYWTTLDDFARTYVGKVLRTPLDGGATTTLVGPDAGKPIVVVDSENVYWTNAPNSPGSPGSIERMPKAGGPITTVASGQDTPVEITITDQSVYWTNQGRIGYEEGSVVRASKGDGTVVTLAAGLWAPTSPAVDTTSVYFTTMGEWGDASAGALLKLTPN